MRNQNEDRDALMREDPALLPFITVYRDHTSVIKDFLPQPGRGFRVNYQFFS